MRLPHASGVSNPRFSSAAANCNFERLEADPLVVRNESELRFRTLWEHTYPPLHPPEEADGAEKARELAESV